VLWRRLRIVDAAGGFADAFPIRCAEFVVDDSTAARAVSYLVTTIGAEPTAEQAGYRVTRDGSTSSSRQPKRTSSWLFTTSV
jgi:hypothetical protein